MERTESASNTVARTLSSEMVASGAEKAQVETEGQRSSRLTTLLTMSPTPRRLSISTAASLRGSVGQLLKIRYCGCEVLENAVNPAIPLTEPKKSMGFAGPHGRSRSVLYPGWLMSGWFVRSRLCIEPRCRQLRVDKKCFIKPK